MQSTKKKAIESKGVIVAQGRVWTKEQMDSYRKYQTQYRKDHYRAFAIRFNRDTDEDIIKFMEAQESLTDTMRTILRDYLKKHKTKAQGKK